MDTIFVTGGTGLLGRAVLTELASMSVYNISALKRESSKIEGLSNKIDWVHGDLIQPHSFSEELSKADLLIHMGAIVDFNPQKGAEVIDFNVQSTKNLVDHCLNENIRLIYVSSVSALGSLNDNIIDESKPFDLDGSNTDYALSKYLAEIEVWRGIAEGLNAVILNPSIILGIPSRFPNSTGAIWKKIDDGLSRYPIGTTGFVDARDVAKIIGLLIEKPISGQRFIVNAENWSYEQLLKEIAMHIGVKPPKKALKAWQGNLLWRFSSIGRSLGIEAPYTKALHKISNRDVIYDSSKVMSELNFSFRPLEESIEWMSKAYIDSKN